MKIKKIIKPISIIFLFFFSIANTFACTCINKLDIIESIKSNEYIFIGDVETIERVKIEKLDLLKVTFSVESYFKNKKCQRKKSIVIYTNYEKDMCGYSFELGKRYIVYADLYKKKYVTQSKLLKSIIETDICTRTRLYDSEEHEVLRNNKKEKKPKKSKKNIKYKAVLNNKK